MTRYDTLRHVTTRYDTLRHVTTRYDTLRQVTRKFGGNFGALKLGGLRPPDPPQEQVTTGYFFVKDYRSYKFALNLWPKLGKAFSTLASLLFTFFFHDDVFKDSLSPK